MMSAATIRDVAKKANVGIATVSRVINKSPAVSEETRQKVLEAIAELDYTPNPMAQRLSLGRTLTIGVITPFLTLPSYTERLRGIQHAIADSEYDLVLFSVGNPNQKDIYFERLSRKSQVDGLLILSLSPDDNQARRFIESSLPIVLIDTEHESMCRIVVDNISGGRQATNHLIDLGHQKIAFISDQLDTPFNFTGMRDRYTGYRQALAEAGISFNPKYHVEGEVGGWEAFQKAKELLALDDRPTGIFAASDTYAISVIKAAQERDINVPEELSVIGFDGIRDAEYLGITTMKQPLYESGIEGVHLLFDAIDGECQPPKLVQLPIRLTLRETTAKVA
jgi:DNA-binding LacI/PurR family transcriptional regulator